MVRGKIADRKAAVRDTYLELIHVFPLRPIRNDRELDKAVEVIDSLIDKEKLDAGESDYLDVLSDLVERYEDETIELAGSDDSAMLAHLIEAAGLTQAEVSRRSSISSST